MEIKDLSPRQHKELVSISPLLCQCGYIESADMCSDKPDICLPSKTNRQIGIEVTEYTYPKDEESISVVHRMLQDYISGISERKLNNVLQKYSKDKHYCLTVWFHGGSFPRINKINRHKKQIFEELDRFAFPCCESFVNDYIASLELEEITNSEITESIVHIPYVEAYSQIDETMLLNCIRGKEEKLREYKNIEDNKSISEYWLAIIISDPIQIDIKNYQLHDTLISGYNRIFLIKGIHCVQIK